jgi:hypothetical protein
VEKCSSPTDDAHLIASEDLAVSHDDNRSRHIHTKQCQLVEILGATIVGIHDLARDVTCAQGGIIVEQKVTRCNTLILRIPPSPSKLCDIGPTPKAAKLRGRKQETLPFLPKAFATSIR